VMPGMTEDHDKTCENLQVIDLFPGQLAHGCHFTLLSACSG
jgi:hypothetical protein